MIIPPRIVHAGDIDRVKQLIPDGKRYLDMLKTEMSFNELKQLRRTWIVDSGTRIMVQSIFGIDQIHIVTPEKEIVTVEIIPWEAVIDLIFLYFSDTEYAVWQIDDNGRLEPYSLELEEVTTKWFPYVSGDRNPSVCKSNDNNNEHYISIETQSVDVPGPSTKWNSVGRIAVFTSWNFDTKSNEVFEVLINVPNGWRYPSWSSNVEKVFDLVEDYTGYLVSSRNRDFIDSDDKVAKNLRLITNTSTTGDITYTKEGVDYIGATISYADPKDIYAILSKDKFIGVDMDSFTYQSFVDPYTFTWKRDCFGLMWPTINPMHSYNGNEYEYLFGSVVLEKYLGTYLDEVRSSFSVGCPCNDNGNPFYMNRVDQDDGEVTVGTMLDYSNVDVDKTFICFYSFHHGTAREKHFDERSVNERYNGLETNVESHIHGGIFAERRSFRMAYRLNNANLVKVEICNLRRGEYIYWTATGGPDCAILRPLAATHTHVNGMQGNRIRKISTSITDKHIFYTYIYQTYSGKWWENHFNDMYDNSWTFNYRILGVIDIETGVRTEYEVDNLFLGNLYEGKFDPEKAAAIGMHRIIKTGEDKITTRTIVGR